jgi:type IV pilus assembly protein PilF
MKLHLLLLLCLLTGCVTTGQVTQKKAEEADRVHTDLAVLYYTRQQYDIALEETKIALKHNGAYARAYAIRALIHEELGEKEAAESDFKKAKDLDPHYSENRTNYGIFLCKANRFQEALSEFEAALTNPLYNAKGNALLNAGVCAFDHQDMQKAQNYLLAALKEDPKPAYAYLMLAKVASVNKRYEDALRWLEQFHKVASPTPESLALVRQSLSMIRGK